MNVESPFSSTTAKRGVPVAASKTISKTLPRTWPASSLTEVPAVGVEND
jgi:hypothetical protein